MSVRSDAWRRPDRPPSNPPLVAAFFYFLMASSSLVIRSLSLLLAGENETPYLFLSEWMDEEALDSVFRRLAKSSFRSRFTLAGNDWEYAQKKSLAKLTKHAHEFVSSRLAAENPKRDGKQTPFKGHPVFVAQHATGTCCRSCLEKWHAIPKRRKVTSIEQQRIVELIIEWIRRQLPDTLPEKEKKTETVEQECDTAICETQRELFNLREEP